MGSTSNWFAGQDEYTDEQMGLIRGIAERREAAQGICPEARIVSSQAELAGWFKSVGIAAGVVLRRGQ